MTSITRYAPSPTGNPHVGNIRSALFNYLWAKKNEGKFLLRIEDTDRARFVPEAIHYIEESLNWLGIKYDEEKVFQSDRLPIYLKYADQLIEKGLAYKCFCSPERLDEIRKEQETKKLPPAYDKRCKSLTKEEIAAFEKKGEAFVIRFAMPEKGRAKWDDLVRGEVEIDYSIQDDFVMIKSDGWPTYNFANVIDDHEMAITDVIRGEEFIPSTPKHLALYDAFGWTPPKFGHLPLIVGPDKAKLSKRHGDTAILDWRTKGYLPEAMINFLALLGWNSGTTEEIFDLESLAKEFDLARVQKSPAVFDVDRLNWINGKYIREKYKTEDLFQRFLTEVEEYNVSVIEKNKERLKRALEVEKSRLNNLAEYKDLINDYVKTPEYNSEILVFKKGTRKDAIKGLEIVLENLKELHGDPGIDEYDDLLSLIVTQTGLSNGDIFWPVRVALSGKEKSPSPAELLWVFGQDEAIARIETALDKLK